MPLFSNSFQNQTRRDGCADCWYILQKSKAEIDLDGPYRVRLHSKGDKWRSCLIWPETAQLLGTDRRREKFRRVRTGAEGVT